MVTEDKPAVFLGCVRAQLTLFVTGSNRSHITDTWHMARPGCVNYLRGYTRSSGCVVDAGTVPFHSGVSTRAMALRPYGDQRCRRAIAAIAERCCAGLAGDDSPRRDEEQAAAAAVPGLLLPRIEETLSKKMDVLVRPTVGRNVFITVRQVLTADLGLRNK
ncbi:hypothetical protein Bbelb_174350 [Branchiostoma belcheri]|nr:hypothetical protein Bbelb_174350 [Branchiostoma belcheri]